MYYGTIKTTDIANGIGVRVTLFVSGCTHHCKGCFQPETWDFKYGSPYTKATQQHILNALNHPSTNTSIIESISSVTSHLARLSSIKSVS